MILGGEFWLKINNIALTFVLLLSCLTNTTYGRVDLDLLASIKASVCVFDINHSVTNINAGTLPPSSKDGFHKNGENIQLKLNGCENDIVKSIKVSGDTINGNMWREKNLTDLENNAGTSFGIGISEPIINDGLAGNMLTCSIIDAAVVPGDCIFKNQNNINTGTIKFKTGIIKKTYSNSTSNAGKIKAQILFELELQ